MSSKEAAAEVDKKRLTAEISKFLRKKFHRRFLKDGEPVGFVVGMVFCDSSANVLVEMSPMMKNPAVAEIKMLRGVAEYLQKIVASKTS